MTYRLKYTVYINLFKLNINANLTQRCFVWYSVNIRKYCFQDCFIEMYNEHETLLFDMSNLSTHTSHNLLALETISDVSMCDTKLVLCLNYFI